MNVPTAAPPLAHPAVKARVLVADDQKDVLAALKLLLGHTWPGNVRELDHAVERAVLLALGGTVRAVDLALKAGTGAAVRLDEMTLEEVERALIQKALERAGGNVTQAARALGLSRSAMYRRLQQHGL